MLKILKMSLEDVLGLDPKMRFELLREIIYSINVTPA